ncbi:MAG: hypothetical protein AB7V42_16335 [Thermoleophilia bacterium]
MSDPTVRTRFGIGLPSPAMVVAVAALLVALSGSAFAVKATFNGAAIKNGTIAPAKIKKNSLTGAQIKESTLAEVPLAEVAEKAQAADTAAFADQARSANGAATATHALTADSATSATTLGGLPAASYLSGVTVKYDPCAVGANTLGECVAVCPPGLVALGGGGYTYTENATGAIVESNPSAADGQLHTGAGGAPAWHVAIKNGGAATTIRAFVVCAKTG